MVYRDLPVCLILAGWLMTCAGCRSDSRVDIDEKLEGTATVGELQLRTALVAACLQSDPVAVRKYARRLERPLNQPLGSDGARLLNEWGVEPKYFWRSSITPALAACLAEEDEPEIVRALAEAGIDFSSDPNGVGDILYYPIVRDQPQKLKAFLDAGCSPDAIYSDDTDHTGRNIVRSPIILAAVKSPAAFRVLLDAGAETDCTNSLGWSLQEQVVSLLCLRAEAVAEPLAS